MSKPAPGSRGLWRFPRHRGGRDRAAASGAPRRRRAAGAVLAAALALAARPTVAAAQPARPAPMLPGLGPSARRVLVDPALPPWRGLLRIETALGGRCTGFLLSPLVAITAAHCLWLPRVGWNILPGDVEVLLGADLDRDRGRARVRAFRIPAGFDGSRPIATAPSDRAVLLLDRPIGTAADAFRLADAMPAPGTRLMVAGYGQDRILRPLADPDCRLLDSPPGLVRHDCAATRGTSGGPVLASEGGVWRVIGVEIESDLGRIGGVAAALVPAAPGRG